MEREVESKREGEKKESKVERVQFPKERKAKISSERITLEMTNENISNF